MSKVTDDVALERPSRREDRDGVEGGTIAGSAVPESPSAKQGRLLSLDAFRGITMFLLIAEGAGVYHALQNLSTDSAILSGLITQFSHHPWNGLRFWDLVQPFFMFIVGVAMPFSFAKRWGRGDTWLETFGHVLYRSVLLLLLGVGLHCIYSGELVWELWNVLAQLSFTYLVAFLMMRRSTWTQIGFTFGLLLFTELIYRLWAVPGFGQPFTPDHNFGSYMDMVLMGKLSGGHWVAFNAVPTTAHTMWGVLAGQLLRSDRSAAKKIRVLVIAGLIGVVVGYALDPVTPIIKRICTSSFVIVSGGWCLLALAFLYWLIEVKRIRKWSFFFVLVGMNPLFIYLFSQTIAQQWLVDTMAIFTMGFLGWMEAAALGVTTALAVLAIEWYLCYWLYKHKVFIKL